MRQDRVGRIRGGVCLFLRDDLTGEKLDSFSNSVCELLVVKVHQINTILIVIYRLPDTKLSEFMPVIRKVECLQQSLPTPSPNIVMMGDFNFPKHVMSWVSVDGVNVPNVAGHRAAEDGSENCHERQQAGQLCELANMLYLTQEVDLPTRGNELLDLIWSSNKDLVSSLIIEDYAEFTDHRIISATTTLQMKEEGHTERQFLLDSGK